jgi:integrase
MINSQVLALNLKGVGRHLSRPKSQRGELSEYMPKRGKLARGRYWARWRIYVRQPDGREKVKRAEKIIDRTFAEKMGFILEYNGPLTKTDAWKALAKLIQESNGAPTAFNAKTIFGELAREYIDLNKPNWGRNTVRSSVNLIENHLIGRLGQRPIRELADADAELQRLINEYVDKESSVSLLSKLTLYLRAILDMAVDRRLIDRNPARKLKAKSRRRPSKLFQMLEECDRLLSEVSGRDHLAIRLLVQLGLRAEELAALRRNDVRGAELIVDESMVDGHVEDTKTPASAARMFVPPDLWLELQHYLETVDDCPEAWLFPSSRKHIPMRPANFLRRVLKPAAIRAKIAIRHEANGTVKTGLNFQTLRRTSSTWFGDKAKDPKSIQAHMRHSDPLMSLRVYQQEVPATVKAASLAFEADLLELKRKREAESGVNNPRVV